MQWNIPELCFCSNNTLTLQFCSPFSTLHYSRSFYIALCTLHFVLCTLHFALCTVPDTSVMFLVLLHLFQTLLYPSYYFALFQNTLVYPLYYILLYLKHSYVSVRHRTVPSIKTLDLPTGTVASLSCILHIQLIALKLSIIVCLRGNSIQCCVASTA